MESIHDTVQQIARRVFQLPTLELHDSTTAADVEQWDSLSHIQFIIGVEQALGVRFRNAEIARLRCIGDLKTLAAKYRPELTAA
jgi:acyl carrier protein